MIKKLLSIALVAEIFSVNAQTTRMHVVKSETSISLNKAITNGSMQSTNTDTLKASSMMPGGCAVGTNTVLSGYALYGFDVVPPKDSGYVFGINVYGDLEKAQKYTVVGTATVTNVLIWAKAKGTSTIKVNLYNVSGTTKGPGTTNLGSSAPMVLSAMNNLALTNFTITVPAVITNSSFFASAVMPATPVAVDTFGIVSTKINCNSNDSLAWEKFSDNSWHSVKTAEGINVDLSINPIVQVTSTGINNYVSKGDLSLYAASPNPASNSININFSLNNSSKVEIEVYDVTGKVVKTVKGETNYAAGKNAIAVDLSNLESGSYIYSVNANGTRIFSKFIVTK